MFTLCSAAWCKVQRCDNQMLTSANSKQQSESNRPVSQSIFRPLLFYYFNGNRCRSVGGWRCSFLFFSNLYTSSVVTRAHVWNDSKTKTKSIYVADESESAVRLTFKVCTKLLCFAFWKASLCLCMHTLLLSLILVHLRLHTITIR